MAEENVVKRIPPHDDEAERSVIASMIIDRDAASEISALLSKDDFYVAAYGIIFQAIVDLTYAGLQIDELILANKLKEMGAPEELCSTGYITDIVMQLTTSAFAIEHAEIVKNKANLRRLIKLADGIAKNCYEDSKTADMLANMAEDEIFKLVQNMNKRSDYTPIRKILIDVIGEIEEAYRHKGRINGIPTGFTDLDNKLTGMHKGELILVAARPSMGKTAFVLNIAHYVAVKEKVPVAIFSLEMTKESLVNRLISVDAMVDAQDIRTGNVREDDWLKIIESTDNISRAPLIFNDGAITMAEMRSKCRKLKHTDNIGLIIIDYLQLISKAGRVESQQQFISDCSRALKMLAHELQVPVIALSQLNRAADARPDHRPVLSDLRDSGAIEQDADVVIFIHREERYNPDTERKGIADIIVAKQRNGSIGPVELAWLGKYTKFSNLARKQDNADAKGAGNKATGGQ
jgi:replicative DNA helicase